MNDEVHARINLRYEDHETPLEVYKMTRKGDQFTLSYTVGEKTSAMMVYFQSGEKYDRPSTLTIQPKTKEGKYYQNGLVQQIFNTMELYKDELAEYPHNYTAYRYRWQILPYKIGKDSAKTIIDEEIKELTKKGKKNEAYYYALACGNANQGNFEAATESFGGLLKKFPQSHLITDANSFIGYQLFTNSASAPEIDEMILDFIKKNPETALAKQEARELYNKDGEVEDLAALSRIADYWMEKEPDNAMMYYHHANTLEDQAQKLFYYNKAFNTFLNGDWELKNGYTWGGQLSYSMYRLAKALRNNGAPAQALGIGNLIETHHGEKEAYFVMQKGRILQDLHRYKEALHTYLSAADMGEQAGKDSAMAIFNQHGFYGDFEEYAFEVSKEQFYSEKVSPAPTFKATDLEGNSYKLEELKGKVVVLNFWFIGCAPCRVEMPGLNEMVAEYEGKDVVFLAFALDDQGSLEEFLETTEFAYQVLPSSHDVSESYEVNGYPTHVVIDKEGNIRSTLVGGSPTRHENIKPLIDRALSF